MVEALSGGRWQGSSSAESSTVTTEQDLFNSSFTTSGNASQTTATDTTGKVVMTQSGGSGNNAKAYRTLSNSYNAKTFTIDFTFTRNSGDNANNSGVSFGSDNTADGNISGNAKRLMFAFENGSYIRVKVETVATNNTFTDTTSFQATGTTKYYRFVGNGSNVVLTMFPTLSDRTNGTNADRTYQSVDFPSDWLTTDSIDTFTLEGWSGYHAGNWEVSDVQISMNNYADEKDSLNSVPLNSRYEETDTRKIYRFGGINTSGLKALYNFDSSWSNNATDSDSITTGGDMTAQNNATFSTSVKKLGTASASFPADGDYAKTSTANGANFDFTGDSTVTLWVYRTDGLDSSYHAMVSKRSGGNSEYNLYLEPVSSGVSKPHLYITMGSSTFNGSATGAIPDSTWTHLATTIDGDVMKYYINGALDSTHDLNGAKGTLASQPFGVGAISGTGTEGYQGYLDQVSVWNRALSASEISTIYNSGTGKNIAGWIERNTA